MGGRTGARSLCARPLLSRSRASACSISLPAPGLSPIAAARAGAAPVIAADIDAFAETAIALNAAANDTYIEVLVHDLLDRPTSPVARYDVILVGDLSTSGTPRRGRSAFSTATPALGARVLIGDPGRTYLPEERLRTVRRISHAGDARARGSRDQAHGGVGGWVPDQITFFVPASSILCSIMR